MAGEKFNPSSPEYRQVKDLPEEHRGEFVDIPKEEGGGFVRKEAAEPILEAKIEAIIKNDPLALKRKLDELHAEALEVGSEKVRLFEAVKQDGWALESASEYLRADRDIVLEAVKHDGGALEFASEDLQNNLEFLLMVAKINPKALAYAPEDIRKKLGIE